MRQNYATHYLDSLSLNRTKQRTWMENSHANNFNKAKCGKDCNQIERLLDGIFIALIVFSPAMGQKQVSPMLPLFCHVGKVAKPLALLVERNIRLLTGRDFPPFSYETPEGRTSGVSVDLEHVPPKCEAVWR